MEIQYAQTEYGEFYWQIKFNDDLGQEHTYMNCAFPSEISAERELKRIIKNQIKFKKDNPYFDPSDENNMNVSSISIGCDWRIKKRKTTWKKN